jgi:hypothetical protein
VSPSFAAAVQNYPRPLNGEPTWSRAKVVVMKTASSHVGTIYVIDSSSSIWMRDGINSCSQAIPQHVEPT